MRVFHRMRTIAAVLLALAAPPLRAQMEGHEHMHHEEPAAEAEEPGHAREGSGTAWMPDTSPVRAHHFMADDWMLMLHYSVLAGYDDQWSDRGSRRFTSVNWLMGMASHPLLDGDVTLRTMLSLEPATAGGATQIPLLLQSGETYGGAPLHDRQHPHDLFMEVAAIVRHPLAAGLSLELYGAAAGEPALGPVAFMHRPSASVNPFPPIAHHWQDATHISYGVATVGVYNRFVKLEGSIFNAREPDEDRWDFDFAPLDSWSARLSVNPTATTSAQVSYGRLHSPEAVRPDEDDHRLTASLMWTPGDLAFTAVYGRNIHAHVSSDSVLAEAQLELPSGNVPFLRVEYVDKLGEDLVVPGDADAKYGVVQAVLGFARRFRLGPIEPLAGIAVDVGHVPAALEGLYGTRWPVGAFVYVGLQPPRMEGM
jgi:hypothetical protein